jgi:Zn-finger nucleic acid-binding protein
MNCPVDGTTLVMSDRQGVEIDYCPSCRGVWLDRGELDKIIDRAADDDDDRPRVREYREDWPRDREYREDRYERREAGYRPHDEVPLGRPGYKKKKRGFLGELFEFDD